VGQRLQRELDVVAVEVASLEHLIHSKAAPLGSKERAALPVLWDLLERRQQG